MNWNLYLNPCECRQKHSGTSYSAGMVLIEKWHCTENRSPMRLRTSGNQFVIITPLNRCDNGRQLLPHVCLAADLGLITLSARVTID